MKPSQLFQSEDQWTKGAGAVDKAGVSVDLHSPEACRWCLYGRLLVATPEPARFKMLNAIVDAIGAIPGIGLQSVTSYNDRPATTFDDLQTMLKKADEFYEAKSIV